MRKLFMNAETGFRHRVWLGGIIGVCVIWTAGSILSANFSSYAEQRYRSILSQPAVLEAFAENDEALVQDVAHRYHLQYQRVTAGEVVFRSQEWLPEISLIIAVSRPQKNVLMQDVLVTLQSLKPRTLLIRGDIFLVFPIFLQAEQPGNGYVVYMPLFV